MTRFLTTSALVLWLFLGINVYASEAVNAFNNNNISLAKQLFSKEEASASKAFYLGRIALIERQFDQAENLLKRAVTLTPDNADYHYWFGHLSLLQAANASIFTAPGYASDAREHLLQALKLQPSHVNASKDLISFYLNAPAIAGGSVNRAEQVIKQLVVSSPANGYSAQLDLYHYQQAQEKEINIAKLISEQFPHHAEALLAAGFSFQRHQAYHQAFDAFTKVSNHISEETNNTTALTALYQLGKTAVISGQRTSLGIDALNEYLSEKVNQNLPSKNWARYRLASLYRQQGQMAKAKELAMQASEDRADKPLQKRVKKLLKQLG